MKKILVLLIIVTSCLCMNGCNMKSNMRMDEKKYQKKLGISIQKALNKKSKKDFEKIFSSKIRNNTFEKGIEHLFNVIDSPIVDIEMSTINEMYNYENENHWRRIQCHYILKLKDKKFYFYIESYMYYERDKSIEGISYIGIDSLENNDKNFRNDDYFIYNTPKEGIYYPGWENDQE